MLTSALHSVAGDWRAGLAVGQEPGGIVDAAGGPPRSALRRGVVVLRRQALRAWHLRQSPKGRSATAPHGHWRRLCSARVTMRARLCIRTSLSLAPRLVRIGANARYEQSAAGSEDAVTTR